MKFAIEFGGLERHRLEYYFNQLLGRLSIKINEQSVTQSLRLVNEPEFEVYEFEVGDREKSTVRIEKVRKPLIGHINRLYVNNRLLKVFEGRLTPSAHRLARITRYHLKRSAARLSRRFRRRRQASRC